MRSSELLGDIPRIRELQQANGKCVDARRISTLVLLERQVIPENLDLSKRPKYQSDRIEFDAATVVSKRQHCDTESPAFPLGPVQDDRPIAQARQKLRFEVRLPDCAIRIDQENALALEAPYIPSREIDD
jgi:hypothetical protein